MKYCITILDGMADYPLDIFNGKTCVEAAETPNLDYISTNGQLGVVQSVPEGYPPGSDVAAMSLLGYDPGLYYTGRAPIEAASIGINLEGDITAFRCNLVTVKDELLDDYSSGHITNEEAYSLIAALNENFETETIKFHPGISYRHIMTYIDKTEPDAVCYPPHDITGKPIKEHMPEGGGDEMMIRLMEESRNIFAGHEVNRKRIADGKNPASMIWLWGQGRKPSMPSFSETYGLRAAVISAVDLVKGLASILKMDVLNVPGVTGNIDTDYDAKARYAIDAFSNNDLVVIHIEAPDEMGHSGKAKEKVKSIEDIDKKIIGPVLQHLQKTSQDFRFLALPDHYTPIVLKTHSREPVPFAIFGQGVEKGAGCAFTEDNANKSGLKINQGHELMNYFLGNSIGSK